VEQLNQDAQASQRELLGEQDVGSIAGLLGGLRRGGDDALSEVVKELRQVIQTLSGVVASQRQELVYWRERCERLELDRE